MYKHFVPAAIWLGTVTYCSVVLPPSLPDFNLINLDKLIHFGIYALACILLLGGFRFAGYPLSVSLVTKSVLFIACWGASMEGVQAALPYRSFELGDMLANTIGATLAPIIYWVLRKIGFY